jgi:predicted negative regulator of RcsB-dependent stress response
MAENINDKNINTAVQLAADTSVDATEKLKSFWSNNGKKILIGLSAFVLILGAYIGYKKWYKEPQEEKANIAIFKAENLFAAMSNAFAFNADSCNLVLKGDKTKGITGIIEVVKNFGGTATGNRAKYIAGATYLNLKDFTNAQKYLADYKATNSLVDARVDVLLGHVAAEQNKTDDALSFYKKAVSAAGKDEAAAAEALYLAASFADAKEKISEATSLYKELKEKYPTSEKVANGTVDKYLAKLGILN